MIDFLHDVQCGLRSRGEPTASETPLRNVVAGHDRHEAVYAVRTLAAVGSTKIFGCSERWRVFPSLMGRQATLLALVDTYGMVDDTVGLRRAELGIRPALGASRRDLMVLVAKRGALDRRRRNNDPTRVVLFIVVALSQATRQAALPPEWNLVLAGALFAVVLGASYGRARPFLAMKVS